MCKRNAYPVLICIFFTLLVTGCRPAQPTYSKKSIEEAIIALCKKEYNTQPKVWLLGETLWIYIPQPQLITKEAQWNKETIEKVNKVKMGACRVVLSMNPRPKFMAVVASDIGEYGIDCTIINWINDIIKVQLQNISRDEFFRRSVIKIEDNPRALFDREGKHIEKKDIKLEDFLVEQIAQRINASFTSEAKFKDYFQVGKTSGFFNEDTLRINADIKQIKTPPTPIDMEKEIARIVAYVIKAYELKELLLVEIENTATGQISVFSRAALKEFLNQ